jgi:membrane protein YdbS with pleckstrin-like domain
VKPRPPKRRPQRELPVESRGAEFLTVIWLLSALTALVCQVCAALTGWYVHTHPLATGVAALAAVLMFAALVIGTLSLGMLVAVWKLREVKPPAGLAFFAATVSALPWLVLAARWLF